MFGQEELWRYREGNRLELKEAQGGLPRSFWEPTPPSPIPKEVSLSLVPPRRAMAP